MKEKNDKNENIFSFKPLPAINERVKKLVDAYAKGSVKKFSEIIQLSNSQKLNRVFNLDKRNGEYPEVSSDIILSIANMFPDLNTEWLLTGKGEMLKKNNQPNTVQESSNLYKKEEETLLYKMYREKDAEASKLREQVGALKKEIENLTEEITLIRTLLQQSQHSQNVGSVLDVNAKR